MSRFQILSLDGGGVKGLFSAAVLAAIEDDLNVRITDHFDLITGTSTGGIIALGLGARKTPREIVNFYVQHGPEIFKQHAFSSVGHLLKVKYSSDKLEGALRKCFGEALLGSSKSRLVIPSYNLGEDDVYLFKTRHHDRLNRDHNVPFWKVAMATSAAPTFLPSFNGIDNMRLIDGGVWANNPIMVGITEALSVLNVPLESIRVFSLGTTEPVIHRKKQLDGGGLLRWSRAAVSIILRSQNLGAQNQATHLLPKDSILRLEPKVPDGLFDLDKLNLTDLLSKAAHESRKLTNQFEEMFSNHKADEFLQNILPGGNQ